MTGALAESWRFWALLAALFAALTAILAKIGIADVDSNLATFVRTGVILVLTLGIVLATGQGEALARLPGKSALFLVLSGLATGASWLCYFRALSIGEASRVAPLDKLSVVFVAVFGVLFLGERLSTLNWLGVALIATGAVLVAIRV